MKRYQECWANLGLGVRNFYLNLGPILDQVCSQSSGFFLHLNSGPLVPALTWGRKSEIRPQWPQRAPWGHGADAGAGGLGLIPDSASYQLALEALISSAP